MNSVDHDCISHTKGARSRRRLWACRCDDSCRRFCSDKKARRRPIVGRSRCAICRAGSNQTTTLDCAGGGAHIFGSNNTLTLTGACTWLDMVGSNNPIIIALANGANIEFAGSNNAITWTSPDGKEPVVRHLEFWQQSHCWTLGRGDLPILQRRGESNVRGRHSRTQAAQRRGAYGLTLIGLWPAENGQGPRPGLGAPATHRPAQRFRDPGVAGRLPLDRALLGWPTTFLRNEFAYDASAD